MAVLLPKHPFCFVGLGSYAQEASQYGPTRGGISDAGAFTGSGPGGSGVVPSSGYGGEPGAAYPSASMYDGMGRAGGAPTATNASRGYHPYGR